MRVDLESANARKVTQIAPRYATMTVALTGTFIIPPDAGGVFFLDTNGSNRDVYLPAIVAPGGQEVRIFNTGAQTITVRDAGGVAITTLDTTFAGIFTSSATAWRYVKSAATSAAAPLDAEYLVKTVNGDLSAERVVTDGAAAGTAVWDWSVAGQVSAKLYVSVANRFLYSTGANAWAEGAITSVARAFLAGLALENSIYVSKAGNDTNSGQVQGAPKLTIGSAITAAVALGATKATVVVLDAGQYTENLTLAANIELAASSATLIGTLSMDAGARATLWRHYSAANSTTLVSTTTASGEASFYSAAIVDGRGTGGVHTGTTLFENASSGRVLFVRAEQCFVASGGFGVRDNAGSGFGHVHLLAADLYLAGNNAIGLRSNNANSNIVGYVDHILEISAPTGTKAIQVGASGGTVKLTASEIIADEVYDLDAAGTCYIQCPKLTGTRTGAPTVVGGWDPSAADRFLYGSGAGATVEGTITAAGRALIDDASASAQRTTLGVGTGDSPAFAGVVVNNDGLKTKDSDASHNLIISTDSNLTADRTLNLNTGDASRALTISGDHTLPGGTSVITAGNQTLTGGFTASSYNAGTKSSGTFTPDPANGNFQYATNGGAHTLAPPSNDCTIIVQYTNNGSAGTITTSGFTKVSGTAPGTTNGDDFLAYIVKLNGFSHLTWQALQ